MRRLSLFAAALAVPATTLAQQADSHAIVGARVLTVSGASYERATIVMRDGLITAVGPDVTPPPGARVLDGTGLVVTPGLVDALSAIGLPAPAKAGAGGPAGGGTGAAPAPLAPQALALERVKAADVAKARDSGITTALVIPKEGVLPGQSAILNLAGDRPEAMVLRQPAALHLHMASLGRQYPDSLMGTMAWVRQALADAARAREAWAAWDRAPRGQKRPRYDASLLPWQEALAGRLPLVVTCNSENDVRRALALSDEWKLRIVLANAPQAARLADLLKGRRAPLLVGVNFDPPKTGGFFGFDEEQERRRIREAEENPAALARAGVPFGFASAWAPDYVAGIRRAIERGLPRETALRAGTLGAAEALALADRTGSLGPGRASPSRRRRRRATSSWTVGSTSRRRRRRAARARPRSQRAQRPTPPRRPRPRSLPFRPRRRPSPPGRPSRSWAAPSSPSPPRGPWRAEPCSCAMGRSSPWPATWRRRTARW
jgi:imidazolonepropionase-like amidohydrolase